MSKLILVAGALAGGKSTFAGALSRALGIPCCLKDTIKEALGQHLPYDTRDQNAALSLAAFDMLYYMADAFLKAGCPAVLESNFRQAEAQALGALAQRREGRLLTFLFDGDAAMHYDRYLKRDASSTRAKIHKSHGIPTLEEFAKWQALLTAIEPGGTIVRVDSSCPSGINYEVLTEQAREFLGND